MTEVTATPKLIKILTKVYHPIGPVTWEWMDLPGTEIKFEGVTIGNGEAFTLTHELSFSTGNT